MEVGMTQRRRSGTVSLYRSDVGSTTDDAVTRGTPTLHQGRCRGRGGDRIRPVDYLINIVKVRTELQFVFPWWW